MDLGLKGKTAVITGGTKGIGAGCSEVLAQEGCNVVMVYRSDPEGSEAFAQKLADTYGVGALAYCADVTHDDAIDGIFDAAIARFGKVDILINNAAGGVVKKPLEQITPEEWRTAMDGCLNHVFTVSRRFVADCRKDKRGGHIVNVLAKAAITTNSHNNSAYVTGKGGMTILTRTMANDLIEDGIFVNGIVPGYVVTSWHQPGSVSAAEKEKFLRVGWATPIEMGNVAAFLCSEKARQIVGAIVDCTGGTML